MTFDFTKLADALVKAIGDNDESATVTKWLDTGFAPLNFAISHDYNGGLPCGRIVEIFGPPSAGKTALATQAMVSAQKQGGVACFHDHERAFYLSLGKKLGLDDSPGRWIYKKPRTFEDSLDLFVKTVRSIREAGLPLEAPICYVFDSLASMIPKSQLEKDLAKQGMHDQTALARATSPTFRVLSSIAEEYNVCIIFLNQLRQKIGVMFGNPDTTPGGNAPEFYASVRIQLGASRLTVGDGEEKQTIGQAVTARVVKNKTSRPFLKAKWQFLYREDGSGYFDNIGSTLDFMVEKGVLQKEKRSIIWTDGNTYSRSRLIKMLEETGGVQELRNILTASGVEVEEDKELVENAKGGDGDEVAVTE